MIKFLTSIAIAVAVISFCVFDSEIVIGNARVDLAPPTAINATDNTYNNKVGIYWNAVRGAATYRVFRNAVDDQSTAQEIGTTPVNFFFDATVPAAQLFFYWVKAENGSVSSGFSLADQGSRTGTAQQGNLSPLGPPPAAPVGNPLTAAKAYLGKALFWDEQMSSTRTVACGSCHHSGSGGTDPRSVLFPGTSTNPGPDGLFSTLDDIRGSAGVPSNNADGTYTYLPSYGLGDQVTGRKSISTLNASYSTSLFWDGRATGIFRDPVTNAIVLNGSAALESQVIDPPISTAEMAHSGRNWTDVAARIAASKPLVLSPSIPAALNTWIGGRTYAELFLEAFGTSEVTPVRIAMAIASFERTLFTDQAPIDLANAGIAPLTAQEQRGRALFNSTAHNCAVCHNGNRFTDNAFHYIGVRPDTDDIGRESVTGIPNDRGTFRTPSLRNVELRGSYFHNGRFSSLEEVVDFYDRGGDFDANNKPNLIHPLGLTAQEKADLVAFLKRPLTDPRAAAETGPFDRPQLYMESDRVPRISGNSRPGSGGISPQIKAISPPVAGNPNFTVSVSEAIGNSGAVLVIDSVDPGIGNSIPEAGSFARIFEHTMGSGPGNGWVSVSMPVPNTAGIVGGTFYARWYVTDPGASYGFSVSRVATFTVFGDTAVSAASISGRVVTPNGSGLRSATVTLSGPAGFTQRVTTSSFGFYSFENIPTGMSYAIGVSSRRYRFAPQNLLLTEDLTEVNFVGME